MSSPVMAAFLEWGALTLFLVCLVGCVVSAAIDLGRRLIARLVELRRAHP